MITKQFSDKKYSNNNNQHLLQLGWTSHFQSQLENFCSKEFIPARVVGVRKNQFRISNGKREWLASTTGRLKHHSDCMYPVTGDWVLVTDTVISEVLIRRNALSRGADILNRKVKNGNNKLHIREAVETDLNDVLLIERLAYGYIN